MNEIQPSLAELESLIAVHALAGNVLKHVELADTALLSEATDIHTTVINECMGLYLSQSNDELLEAMLNRVSERLK